MSKIKIFSLGGLNEMGKNMYIIEVENDIFVFDAGIKYADDRMLGIDYIVPNFDYLKNNKTRIKGIFLTHGHDENMGAVTDIIRDIPDIRIYGTRFTMEVLKGEMIEDGVKSNNLVEIKPYQKVVFGNNSVFPLAVTHSTPDSVGYVLNTPDGAIFYTGDFTFDATASANYKTDMGKLAYVGKQGVLCLLSESTYAEKKGHTTPKHKIADIIQDTFIKNEGRIIVTAFIYSISRLQELFNELSLTNRKIVFMGKSLQTFINNAISLGYITLDKNKIGDLSNLNDENIVILVANERENVFANLSRIANGYDKFVKLIQTDTVFFIENIYDSMERTFGKLADQIAKAGVNVVSLSSSKNLAHHASREDLLLMIDLMNPKYYMPVKGEYRYQYANALLAEEYGIPKENIILKQNGDIVLFEDGKMVEFTERIPTDEILIDGKPTEDVGELVLKDREVLSDNGIVIVSATLDKKTKQVIAGPEVMTRGFIYVKDNSELIKEISNKSLEIIKENINPNYVEYNKIRLGVREKLGKYLYKETERRPMIITVITEV